MPFEKGHTHSKDVKFKPGVSGNPNGRPKGSKNWKTLIKEAADRDVDYKDLQNKTVRVSAGEALINSLFGKALWKFDNQAAKMLLEYGQDKTIAIEGGDEDKPIIAKIVYEIVDDTCPQERDGYCETKNTDS